MTRAPRSARPRGRRWAALAAAGLLATAVGVAAPPAGEAQAQTPPAPIEVPTDWALKPGAVGAGGQFRLMFMTSTRRDATATDIATYDTYVQNRATNHGHAAIRQYGAQFKAVGSTATVDARDHTMTNPANSAHPNVPIYWLNGPEVANDNSKLWSDRWINWEQSHRRTEAGTTGDSDWHWTGTNADGTKHANHLGASPNVRRGRFKAGGDVPNPISHNNAARSESHSLYAISPVFQVANTGPGVATASISPPSYSAVYEGERKVIVFDGVTGATASVAVSTTAALDNFNLFHPYTSTTPVGFTTTSGTHSATFSATVSNGLVAFVVAGRNDGRSGAADLAVLDVTVTQTDATAASSQIEVRDGERPTSMLFRVRRGSPLSSWIETDKPSVTLMEGGAEVSYEYRLSKRPAIHGFVVPAKGPGVSNNWQYLGGGGSDYDRVKCVTSPSHAQYPDGSGTGQSSWDGNGRCPHQRNAINSGNWDDWHTVTLAAGEDADAFGHGFTYNMRYYSWGSLSGFANVKPQEYPAAWFSLWPVRVHIVDDDKWEQELAFSATENGTYVLASDGGLQKAVPDVILPGSPGTPNTGKFYIRLAKDPATLEEDTSISRQVDPDDADSATYNPTFQELETFVRVLARKAGDSRWGLQGLKVGGTTQDDVAFQVSVDSDAKQPNSAYFYADWGRPKTAGQLNFGRRNWNDPIEVTITVYDGATAPIEIRVDTSHMLQRKDPEQSNIRTRGYQHRGYATVAVTGTPMPSGMMSPPSTDRRELFFNTQEGRMSPTDDLFTPPVVLGAGSGTPTTPVARLSATSGSSVAEGGTAVFAVSLDPPPAQPTPVTVDVDRRDGATPLGLAAHLGRRSVVVPTSGRASFSVPTADNDDFEDNGYLYLTIAENPRYDIDPFGAAAWVLVTNDDEEELPPPAVRLLRLTGTTATLEWDPHPGAAGYDITWLRAGSHDINTAATADTTIEITGLNPETDYDVSVIDDTWTMSEKISITTLAPGEEWVAGDEATDDDAPEVSITAGSGVTEGGSAAFTVTADPAPAADLAVSVTVSADGDFGAATGQRTVTVPVSGSASFSVATADDSADEPDGSVSAALDAGDGYTVSTSQGSASVSVADDDDPAPAPEVSITAGSGVTEGGGASFTVTADPALLAPLAVSVTVSAVGDFGAATGTRTVTVPVSGSASFSVATSDDSADEPDGSVSAALDAGDGYTVSTSQGSASVSVADDDPAPEVNIMGSSGGTEGTTATFTVTANPAPAGSLAVSATVSAVGDYGAATGARTVTIPAGGSATVSVPTVDDGANEADGSVTLTLNPGDGYTVGALGAETVQVLDDDDPPVQELNLPRAMSCTPAAIPEGETGSLDCEVTDASWGRVQIKWSDRSLAASYGVTIEGIPAGTEAPGSPCFRGDVDTGQFRLTYSSAGDGVETPSLGEIRFKWQPVDPAEGDRCQWITKPTDLGSVAIADDHNAQPVVIVPPPPPPPPPPTPVVSIAAGSGVTEGGSATFTVTADPAPPANLAVSVTVAQSGDYGAATGQRTVTVPTTGSATFSVSTTDDGADEPDGSVSATLNAGAGYTVSAGQASASVPVADDDPPPPPPPPPVVVPEDPPPPDDDPPVEDPPDDGSDGTPDDDSPAWCPEYGEAPPDGPLTVCTSDAAATEGDDLEFILILNRAPQSDVYVVYVTIAAETTEGQDIVFDDGMITFEPGETHKTVTVTTLDDGAAESDERMALDLVWISGAELANKRAIGTITDND